MNGKSKLVTMRDIAHRAKVSVSTVSLALNNSPHVSEQTKQRITDLASDMGYRAHPLVSALMRSRRHCQHPDSKPNIALVTGHETADGWKISRTLRTFHKAAKEAIEERGFRMETLWRHTPSLSEKGLSRILYARGIRGVLLFPFSDPRSSLEIDWSKFTSVAMGFSIHSLKIDRVTSDHFSSMRRAVYECFLLGYRRIGFVELTHMNQRTDGRWLGGFLSQHTTHPELGEPRILFQDDWSSEIFDEWYRQVKPDVVITSSPKRIRAWATDNGVTIPDDMGLVSLAVGDEQPDQSGMSQNPQMQAERAGDILLDRILQNQQGLPMTPTNILIEGTWKPGKTVRFVG